MGCHPNSEGPCHAMRFPDLHALYFACSAADTRCTHLLLVRDRCARRCGAGSSPSGRRWSWCRRCRARELESVIRVRAQINANADRPHWCWTYGDVSGIADLGRALGWRGLAALASRCQAALRR